LILFFIKLIFFLKSLFAGGTAGVASRTLTSPLDVIKILAQVGTKETKEGFMKSFSNLYSKEGLRAFWKGNTIACLRLFPYNAVQFASYTKLKVLFSDEKGQIGNFSAMLSGSLAGISATIITYPTDTVKTRLTLVSVDKSQSKYKGIVDCFKIMYKEEGLRSFYKGFSSSLLGVIPSAGGTFMAYEFFDKAWGKPRDQMTVLENFVNGCLAAVFAQTFSFPCDTIRKKLQAQSQTVYEDMKPDVEFKGMIDAFRQTIKKYGILGLWRGTTANLAKVVPAVGIMFASFETTKRFFLYYNGYTSSPFKDSPIRGIDQGMRPEELKQWYEQRELKKQKYH